MDQYREGKVGSTPNRGVKQNLKPFVYKRSEPQAGRRRAFCIMSLRVVQSGEVKGLRPGAGARASLNRALFSRIEQTRNLVIYP